MKLVYSNIQNHGINGYSMLPYFPDTPISRHFDFTILYFVVNGKQIRTIRSKDLWTSLLSFVLFAAELRGGKIQVFVEVSKICFF